MYEYTVIAWDRKFGWHGPKNTALQARESARSMLEALRSGGHVDNTAFIDIRETHPAIN